MSRTLDFVDAAVLATSTMVEKHTLVEVVRLAGGWRVRAGASCLKTPWANLRRCVFRAVMTGGQSKHVFWRELDSLVHAGNRTAIAANREIGILERAGSSRSKQRRVGSCQ